MGGGNSRRNWSKGSEKLCRTHRQVKAASPKGQLDIASSGPSAAVGNNIAESQTKLPTVHVDLSHHQDVVLTPRPEITLNCDERWNVASNIKAAVWERWRYRRLRSWSDKRKISFVTLPTKLSQPRKILLVPLNTDLSRKHKLSRSRFLAEAGTQSNQVESARKGRQMTAKTAIMTRERGSLVSTASIDASATSASTKGGRSRQEGKTERRASGYGRSDLRMTGADGDVPESASSMYDTFCTISW